VHATGAPCPDHMFAFHSDGTMQQSNPPAGNVATSDSVGLGLWEDHDGRVLARFQEYRVDTGAGTVSLGVIGLDVCVDGDTLTSSSTFVAYEPGGDELVERPVAGTIVGVRVTIGNRSRGAAVSTYD
jgi:hypothetical protein